MTATGTPVPARDDHGTGQAPDTTTDLETALAGMAYQDLPIDVTEAVRRLLLPDLPAGEWDAYVEAVDAVYKLEHDDADPYSYCDANPLTSTPGAAMELALQEWTAVRDQALKFLVAAAARRYEQNGQAA